MSLIIIMILILIILIGLKFILQMDITTLKRIAKNKELDNLTNSFPSNIEICKKICTMIGNKTVKIEEDKESKTSLYLVVTNKISIANLKDSFTRIQTVAHECIHSMQDKSILWANFIYSIIYRLYCNNRK